ncbi:Alpha/Beta hydrolase protein [Phlyctochytrium arcticum]|nr:Alpha/Beta hydrolase protein [Phlyctochytrium arcticum]
MTHLAKTFRDLPYNPLSTNPKHRLDLYVPVPDVDSDTEEQDQAHVDLQELASRPVVIYLHGGAWRKGDKAEYEFLGDHLASHGLTTAVISYRLSTTDPSTTTTHPGPYEDCATAIEWISKYAVGYVAEALHLPSTLGGHQHEEGDECSMDCTSQDETLPRSTHIYLVGHSCGGHLAMLLTLHPPPNLPTPKGVIAVEAIFDVSYLLQVWPSYIDFISMAFREKDVWENVDKGCSVSSVPPFMIIHSDEQDLMEFGHSERFYRRLCQAVGQTTSVVPGQLPTIDMSRDVKGKHFDLLRTRPFFDIITRFVSEVEDGRRKPRDVVDVSALA